MLMLRSRDLSTTVGRMKAELEARLDAVYSFASLVAGAMGGVPVTALWVGDVAGSGALTKMLESNEQLLQAATPTNLGVEQEDVKMPKGWKWEPEQGIPKREKNLGYSAVSGAPEEAPQRDWAPGEILLWMIARGGVNDAALRAFDMLCYHGAHYVPPGGHQLYTPNETIELARKFLLLQRYFQIDGNDATRFSFSDDNQWYPMFLTPILHEPLLNARDTVWNVCGHAEVPLVDLMTHDTVRAAFAKFVALHSQVNLSTQPNRGGTTISQAQLGSWWNSAIRAFKTLKYTADNRLVFGATYNDAKYQERLARERGTVMTGSQYSAVDAQTATNLLRMQPLISSQIGSGGQQTGGESRSSTWSNNDRERDRGYDNNGERMMRAFGSAATRIRYGPGRARIVATTSVEDL